MTQAVAIWPPMPGLYAMKLAKGALPVAVRIWFGRAIIDGEEQDRGLDWRCEIDGRTDTIERDDDTGYCCRVPLSIHRAWPGCCGRPISQSEFDFLKRRAAWAREWDDSHPAANPRDRIDIRSLKPAF